MKSDSAWLKVGERSYSDKHAEEFFKRAAFAENS